MDSTRVLNMAFAGVYKNSSAFGPPNDQKSACTTNTRNIAMIRSNSMFDCRFVFVLGMAVGGGYDAAG